MQQKLAIVTGGTSGIGFHTAMALAENGFDIIITGRDRNKGHMAAVKLQKCHPHVSIEFRELNLADLADVSQFTKTLLRKWDLLVNNAGAKIERPYRLTSDGFEWHIGVNHFGHAHLTRRLLPSANDGARVVFTTSIVARRGELKLGQNYVGMAPGRAYRDSKLFNLVSALELQQQQVNQGNRLTVSAAHPGFARAAPYGNRLVRALEFLLAQSAKSGAQPIIEACLSAQAGYWGPKVFQLWGAAKTIPLPKSAMNQAERKNFWMESCRQLDEKALN